MSTSPAKRAKESPAKRAKESPEERAEESAEDTPTTLIQIIQDAHDAVDSEVARGRAMLEAFRADFPSAANLLDASVEQDLHTRANDVRDMLETAAKEPASKETPARLAVEVCRAPTDMLCTILEEQLHDALNKWLNAFDERRKQAREYNEKQIKAKLVDTVHSRLVGEVVKNKSAVAYEELPHSIRSEFADMCLRELDVDKAARAGDDPSGKARLDAARAMVIAARDKLREGQCIPFHEAVELFEAVDGV